MTPVGSKLNVLKFLGLKEILKGIKNRAGVS